MTHASGLSAYNYIKRRMAPLSKTLAGLVIPHKSCGSHLYANGEMIDPELEKKNFKVFGKILSQIWGELVLDGKLDELIITDGYDEQWVFKHCRISQYMLQVMQLSSKICKILFLSLL